MFKNRLLKSLFLPILLLVASVGAQAQTPFFTDTLVDTAGTNLESHTATGGVGGTWTAVTGAGGMVISPSGHARAAASGSFTIYAASIAPAGTDYTVQNDYVIDTSNLPSIFGPSGRIDTTNTSGTFYWGCYVTNPLADSVNRIMIYKRVAGTSSIIAQSGSITFTNTHKYRFALSMAGTASVALSLVVTDQTAGGAAFVSISGTDGASPITAAGKAGMAAYLANATDTTGLYSTNFVASQAGNATAYTQSISPTSGGVGTGATLTYTLTGGTTLPSSLVITPAVSGVTGTFSTTTVTIANGSTTGTVTFTPSSAGTATLSATHTGGGFSGDPSGITYTVSASSVSAYADNSNWLKSPYNHVLTGSGPSSIDTTNNTGAYMSILTSGVTAAPTLSFTTSNLSANVPVIAWRWDNGIWTRASVASSVTLSAPVGRGVKHLLEWALCLL